MTLEQLKFMLELINMVSSWKGDKRRFDKKKSELRKVIEEMIRQGESHCKQVRLTDLI